MDKFGIFKLLNSFFNLNATDNADASEQNQNDSSVNDFNLSNFLNAFSTANDKSEPHTDAKQTASKPKDKRLPPLQSSMLKTMTSHDEFVARVKKNNPKP